MGRLQLARQAFHEARVQGKEARARTKADRKAHPEKYTWSAVREENRRQFKPTVEELTEIAEHAQAIHVGRSTKHLVGQRTFSPSGLKIYVSVNGAVFHEVSHLPPVITREFAREIASMGHQSHDGTWLSPVTGVRYGPCWTISGLTGLSAGSSPEVTDWSRSPITAD